MLYVVYITLDVSHTQLWRSEELRIVPLTSHDSPYVHEVTASFSLPRSNKHAVMQVTGKLALHRKTIEITLMFKDARGSHRSVACLH